MGNIVNGIKKLVGRLVPAQETRHRLEITTERVSKLISVNKKLLEKVQDTREVTMKKLIGR